MGEQCCKYDYNNFWYETRWYSLDALNFGNNEEMLSIFETSGLDEG